MILLMSSTANTLLSGIVGIIIGVVFASWWYAGHASSREDKYDFDERDAYNEHFRKVK
jgi:hypothetical protein